MLKRVNRNSIFIGFAWLISLAGVVALLSFISVKKQSVKCTDVKILIPGADNFIEREEVDAMLREDQGMLLGRNLERINIHQIEKKLQANPYIAFAKVYIDMDGVLNIDVIQRQPVIRIINNVGQDFYIDKDGLKMPISTNFTANVLVATGNITEVFANRVDTLHTQLVRDLYKAALFFKKDTLWDAQIEQMIVNSDKDIELVPRVGNQKIILGTADSLEKKMQNLLIFYKKAIPRVGWETYKTINIKFTNQIVCEKRDSTGMGKKTKTVSLLDSVKVQKKVSDSLVRAAISSEINENPIEEADDKPVEAKVAPVAIKTPNKPVAKPSPAKPKETSKPQLKAVETKKTEIKKTDNSKPDTKAAEKKTETVAVKPKITKPAKAVQTSAKTTAAPTTKKPVKTAAQIKLEREQEIKALEKQFKTQQH